VLTIDDLLAVLRDQLGLPVTAEHADKALDEIPGWDSLHLLWLITTLETRTGRQIAMADFLEACTLAEIHDVATR
jgi:acyl carrier protein